MEITKEELLLFKDQIIDRFEKLEKLVENLQTINGKQMLDSKDMRLLLKVCDRTLSRWRDTQKLKCFKISGEIYYMASDVNVFIRDYYYSQTGDKQLNS